jgi:hypothetical protein
MTEPQYFSHYSKQFNEIVKEYIKIESRRLSEVLLNGNYMQIRVENNAIERLTTAKMIIEGQCIINELDNLHTRKVLIEKTE